MKRVGGMRLMAVDFKGGRPAIGPPDLAFVLDDANGGHIGGRAFEKAQKLGTSKNRRARWWRIPRACQSILFAGRGQATTGVDQRSGRPDSRTRHSEHEGS